MELIFEELEECVSDGSSVEATAERREILAAVNRFLGKLPAKKRIMFVSRYCYCESVHDIAARFENVKSNRMGLRNMRQLYLLKGKAIHIEQSESTFAVTLQFIN